MAGSSAGAAAESAAAGWPPPCCRARLVGRSVAIVAGLGSSSPFFEDDATAGTALDRLGAIAAAKRELIEAQWLMALFHMHSEVRSARLRIGQYQQASLSNIQCHLAGTLGELAFETCPESNLWVLACSFCYGWFQLCTLIVVALFCPLPPFFATPAKAASMQSHEAA